MQLAAGDAEDVHDVVAALRQPNQGAGAAVLRALRVGVRRGLNHLDTWRDAEELEGRVAVLRDLVLPVHHHEVVREGAPGPRVARVIPDVSAVGGEFFVEGVVDDAQGVVVAVAVHGVTVEVEGGLRIIIARPQDPHVPAGEVLGAQANVRLAGRGGQVRIAMPQRVFAAALLQGRTLKGCQQSRVAPPVVGGEDLDIVRTGAAAGGGISNDRVLQVGTQHPDHAFQRETVAGDMREGIEVVEAPALFRLVVGRVRAAGQQVRDLLHQAQVHVGIRGRFLAEAVEVEAAIHELLEAIEGSAHALGLLEHDPHRAAECPAGAALVVDRVVVLHVSAAREDEVLGDALVHLGCVDRSAVLVLRVAGEVVCDGDVEQGAALAAGAGGESARAPEAGVQVSEAVLVAVAHDLCWVANDPRLELAGARVQAHLAGGLGRVAISEAPTVAVVEVRGEDLGQPVEDPGDALGVADVVGENVGL